MKNKYESKDWMQLPEGVMRPGGLKLTEKLLEQAALAKGQKILDIGCGMGSTVNKLIELGYRAMGVDISAKLIKEGQLRYPDTVLLVADAANLPFDSGCFDAIICECSLSDMPTSSVLKECYRLLVPVGKVLISDIYTRKDLQAANIDNLDAGLMTQCQWLGLLAQSGFSDIRFCDCSEVFKAFVAQAIWDHGSLEKLFDCEKWHLAAGAKPGYFLLVANKGGTTA